MKKEILIRVACLLLLTACSSATVKTGFLEGHITIGPLVPVLREGESEPTPSPEVYAAYPIIIYEQDGKTEVARATGDVEGNYRLELPVGVYMVATEPRGMGGSKDLPAELTIEKDQVTHLDVDIDTGIR